MFSEVFSLPRLISTPLKYAGLALIAVFLAPSAAFAQLPPANPTEPIGIIVSPTQEQARTVLQQLKAGTDFSVLAREKSTDATAVDGGYMGDLDPSQLREELRAALKGLRPGQLTEIVQIPSGFAVLKVLSAAPAVADSNARRISALLASGAIQVGPAISGLPEADEALRDSPKPDGWDRDPLEVCTLRRESWTNAVDTLTRYLDTNNPASEAKRSATDQINVHILLAQLYSYRGDLDRAVDEWKAAYRLAETSSPGNLPMLEESIGASYLHLSEMENRVYRESSELDIFPPLHPHTGFERTEESKQAISYFTKYLEQRPDDWEVKWLLNLAYMTLGEYPEGVPAAYRIPESVFQSKETIGRFRDVAPAAGLNVFRQAGGVLVDDFENNGLLDVVVSSSNVCDPIRYFHNNGDGTFSDRTEQAGLMDQLGGLNLVEADYNNDGCMDILILRGGWEFPERKSLLKNNCDGTFTDVTDASGLGITVTSTQSAAWADIDNDGYLDLFLINENAPAQLFHNKGDGTFEEIGASAGIARTAFSKGVTAADYDHDGFVDFYVTNKGGENFLYHNNGDKTFTEVGRQAGVQQPSYSFAAWFFDYDNDGWPDLFVNSYQPSVAEAVKSYLGLPLNAETLKLYRNKHDGTFEDVTARVGLDKDYMTMGSNFGDVDNDGYLDVYLGAGNPSYASMLPHVLLRNKEGKSFVDITQSSGTGELHKGHSIAFADLGRRGFEDIVAQVGGAVPGDSHGMRVFENPGNDNDWINLKLTGVKSNRSAVGAEIHVTVRDGDGPPRSIYRIVGQNSSFGGNPMEQHIGLGHNAHDLSVDVYWPATRSRQHFAGVEKDQFMEIKEFASAYTRLERHSVRLGGSASPRSGK